MWPSGGYLQYLSTSSVFYIHVSNPPTIVSSCWVPDFHAATRWCLPAVSQYFVSVPYSREQSSCQCWRFPSKEWNIIRNVWENCVHVIAIMSLIIVIMSRRKQEKPNTKNWILCLPLSGLKRNSESIPAVAPTSLREAIFDGHGPLRGRLHPAATSTPVFPFPYAYHRRHRSNKRKWK